MELYFVSSEIINKQIALGKLYKIPGTDIKIYRLLHGNE